ncbi:MAG: single-stranded DNA-binding protein, partial [Methylophilaceae bacterium]|nr:single-stranded DNA-binding protein [Methylophilaceae bacterium]
EKDGVTRYSTEIIGDQMQMLGTKGDGGDSSYAGAQSSEQDDFNQAPPREAASQPSGSKAPAATPAGGSAFDHFDDDIPF